MKKLLSILGIFFLMTVSAQNNLTATENYIYIKSCLNGDCTKASEAVQYFDGFGKPFQVISIKSSPLGKDIVQHIPYDSFGRSVDSWKPVPVTTSGGAVQDSSMVKSTAVSVYGDSRPFSHTVLEKSPLSRPTGSILVGQDWQNHSVTMGYYANKANEVKKYVISTSAVEGRTQDILSQSGFYPVNTLVKTSVTDEDGNISIEYKNKLGQVVLIRKGAGTAEEADTYYGYNEYSQLAFVIPPLAVNAPMNQTTYDNLCYQYRYDGWNRLVEKKLPGKGWEYMIYDQQDRLIMSQDANLRTADNTFGAKGWMVTKYDKLGRIAYTGFFPSTDSRATLQNNVSNLTVNAENNEARSSTSFTASGIEVYYTQNAFPLGNMTVLLVNYYDTYPSYSFNPAFPASVFGQEIMTDTQNAPVSTKALPTLSLIKNIEDNGWTKSYAYYDTKGQTVCTYSINHLGGYTKTEIEVDFAGVIQKTKTSHKRLNTDAERIITQNFEYDTQNRLKKQWHNVNGLSDELLADNTYNELSQLTNKKVGNALQSIDYTYDVSGGVKKMNDPANLGQHLFGYELKSFNPQNTVSSTGRYNGNIAEIDWKTSSDNILRRYNYQYDPLNRLKKGIFSEPGSSVPQNDFYNEIAGYDLNGNITSLQRSGNSYTGTAEMIDNLAYVYAGNQLQTVTDNSGNYIGYPDVSGNTIAYDENGNMKNQADKGVLQINYNFLNLPNYMKFDKTYIPRIPFLGDYNVNTKYLYRADGTKLKKVYTFGSGKANNEASTTTEYLDGFQYQYTDTGDLLVAVDLKFVPTSEGYYNFENNKYVYNYTDHLGNIRLSYFKNSTNGSAEVLEENNYYPFGLKHQNFISSGNSAYKYQYNGKELQGETGWNDYGWRQYMPEIGRWNGMDQLSESYASHSPYAYVMNNPVMMFDPDGRVTKDWVMGFWNKSFGNNVTWTNTGNGFESNEKTSVNYEGNWLSLNTDLDGVAGTGILPLVWVNNPSNITWAWQALGYQQAYAERFNRHQDFLAEQRDYYFRNAGRLNDHGVTMIGGHGDILGIFDIGAQLLSTMEPKNRYAAMALGIIGAVALQKPGLALKEESNLWKVGAYKELRGVEVGLDAHHVGQTAVMKKLVASYERSTAPSILVPKLGHTIGSGVVSRSTAGFTSARQVLARDIFELRRVYKGQGLPNDALIQLIEMNKSMYPGAFIK